jgi:hypothetical protein
VNGPARTAERTLPVQRVGALLVAPALGGVGCAAALLFLAMRDVLDIGGSCGTGSPYARCPAGVPEVTIGGVLGVLVLAVVYRQAALTYSVPSFDWLFAPALFLGLGGSFLAYGIDAPGAGGVGWGWIVGGAAFAVPGSALLVQAVRARARAGRGAPANATARFSWIALQLLVIAVGIWGGIRLHAIATG